MTPNDELRRLAEAANSDFYNWRFPFERAANPARILALLDEVEALRKIIGKQQSQIEQLGYEIAETMERNHD